MEPVATTANFGARQVGALLQRLQGKLTGTVGTVMPLESAANLTYALFHAKR